MVCVQVCMIIFTDNSELQILINSKLYTLSEVYLISQQHYMLNEVILN